MKKQVSMLILALLLASYAPIAGHDADISSNVASPLEPQVIRIEISPDPNSIRNLGAPTILSGSEASRPIRADSSIGVYTDSGLFLSTELPDRLKAPRPDLMIVLIDSEVGLWDARTEISDSADVAIDRRFRPLASSCRELGRS